MTSNPNPKPKLERLEIRGWKSIRELDLELRDINILIGPNGVGKSNLIGLFRLLGALVHQKLQYYVVSKGGANALLHFGAKTTPQLVVKLTFNLNAYHATFEANDRDELFFCDEVVLYRPDPTAAFVDWSIGTNHRETKLFTKGNKVNVKDYIRTALQHWVVYHFHDTGNQSALRKLAQVEDNRFLQRDGSNLAAVLYLLQQRHQESFNQIESIFRQLVPGFARFRLVPRALAPNSIMLQWESTQAETVFSAADLSDGSLRFLALAVVFLQPSPPTTILIDEPELGLHPAALEVLAHWVLSARQAGHQVVLATQSAALLDYFEPEDVVVLDYQANQTIATRMSSEKIGSWLEDYSLGQLWEKNILGGRP